MGSFSFLRGSVLRAHVILYAWLLKMFAGISIEQMIFFIRDAFKKKKNELKFQEG